MVQRVLITAVTQAAGKDRFAVSDVAWQAAGDYATAVGTSEATVATVLITAATTREAWQGERVTHEVVLIWRRWWTRHGVSPESVEMMGKAHAAGLSVTEALGTMTHGHSDDLQTLRLMAALKT